MSISSSVYCSQSSTSARTPEKSDVSPPFTQVIDKIYINIGDVFDTENPQENIFLFRLANSLHINTRESVIRDIVLFKSGDVLSMQVLSESERLLRGQDFLYDAVIRPINIRPDKVDIQVFTKDVWTLTPGVSFRREGGEDTSSIKIEEGNFLGYGKSVNILKKNDAQREQYSYQYHDPHLFGSRHDFKIELNDNSDGQKTAIDFIRPFYAIETKTSYGFSGLQDNKVEKDFDTNKDEFSFRHQDDYWETFRGVSRRLSKDRVIRYTYGYTYDQHRYTSVISPSDPTLPIPDPTLSILPDDTRDSYFWFGVQYVEDRFIKTKRINFLNKTEDINLGHELEFRIGWLDKNLGSLDDGIILKGGYQYNAIMHQGALMTHSFKVDGKIIDGRWVNGLLSSKTLYFFKKDPYHTNYLSLILDYGRDLSKDRELVLGGNTGLRGYPVDLQKGDYRFLFTYEKRFYYDIHLFRLYYLGAVVFFDMGRVWKSGSTYSDNQGVLKDIGFGIRMSPSRTGTDLVWHVDVSFPLDGNDRIEQHQVTVKASSKF